MRSNAFLKRRNVGRKSAHPLIEALESLGYSVNGNMKMADSRYEVYLRIGRSILRNYFDYYTKNSMDDAEYIPTVRVIIEGITEEMRSSGMGKPNCKEMTEKLKDYNREMYQNIWIEHAKEDEEPFDLEREYQLAKYTFDYIYEHGEHPR